MTAQQRHQGGDSAGSDDLGPVVGIDGKVSQGARCGPMYGCRALSTQKRHQRGDGAGGSGLNLIVGVGRNVP